MADLEDRVNSETNDLSYAELQQYFPGADQEYLIDYLRNLQENIVTIARTVDALSVVIAENFVFAAYGQLYLSNPPAAFPDLGASYQKVTVFDTASPTSPKNITIDLSNDSMSFDIPGVYAITISGSFAHNSSNQGRTTNVRFFNETTGTPAANEFPIGIGRNVTDSSAAAIIIAEVTEASVGDDFILQIGGGSTVTSVSFSSTSWTIFSVGEFQGEDLINQAVAKIGP